MVREEEINRRCKEFKDKRQIDGFIENNPNLNTFMTFAPTINILANSMKHLMDTTTGDSRYDKLLFMYQYLKISVEPLVLDIIRQYPDEGDKYFKQYMECIKDLKGELDYEMRLMTTELKDVIPELTESERLAKIGELRKGIKEGLGGLIYSLPESFSILPSFDIKSSPEPLGIAGGGKKHYAQQNPAQAAKRRLNTARVSRNANKSVKNREKFVFKNFLKDRREALKGLRLETICMLRELSQKIIDNKEILEKMSEESGTDDGMLMFSGIEKVLEGQLNFPRSRGYVPRRVVIGEKEYDDVKLPSNLLSILFVLLTLILSRSEDALRSRDGIAPLAPGLLPGEAWAAQRYGLADRAVKGMAELQQYQEVAKAYGKAKNAFTAPLSSNSTSSTQIEEIARLAEEYRTLAHQLPKNGGGQLGGRGNTFTPLASPSARPLVPFGSPPAASFPSASPLSLAIPRTAPHAFNATTGKIISLPFSIEQMPGLLEATESRFLPGVSAVPSTQAEEDVLAGFERAYRGDKAMQQVGLQKGLAAMDVSQVNWAAAVNEAVTNGLSAFTGTKNKNTPAGVALVEHGRHIMPAVTSGLSTLLNHPESAGVPSIAELTSLKTMLLSMKHPHPSTKYIEKTSGDKIIDEMRQGYLHNRGKNLSKNPVRYIDSSRVKGIMEGVAAGNYSIGSIGIVTSAPSISESVRSFYGATSSEEISVSPNEIYISIVSPVNITQLESTLASAEAAEAAGIDELARHTIAHRDLLDQQGILERDVLRLQEEKETLRTGASVKHTNIGTTQHTTMSSIVSSTTGAASWIISELNPKSVVLTVEKVPGESEANYKIREGRYIETHAEFVTASSNYSIKTREVSNSVAKSESLTERNIKLEQDRIDSTTAIATNVFKEYGIVHLQRSNFDELAPVVRKFLNKNGDAAIQYAIHTCQSLQPNINPLVSGLLLYSENGPISSTLMFPTSVTSPRLRRAIIGISKLQSRSYALDLVACNIEASEAISYYSEASSSQIQAWGQNAGLNANQIAVYQGAAARAKVLAPAFAAAIIGGNLATDKADLERTLQSGIDDIKTGPFDAAAANNIARQFEGTLSHGIQTGLNVINTTVANGGDILRLTGEIIAEPFRIVSRSISISFMTFAVFASMSVFNVLTGAASGIAIGVFSDQVRVNYGLNTQNNFNMVIMTIEAFFILRKLIPSRAAPSVIPAASNIANIAEKSIRHWSPIWDRRLVAITKNIDILAKPDKRWFTGVRNTADQRKLKCLKEINDTRNLAHAHYIKHKGLYDSLDAAGRATAQPSYDDHKAKFRLILLYHCLATAYKNNPGELTAVNNDIFINEINSLYRRLLNYHPTADLQASITPETYVCPGAPVVVPAAPVVVPAAPVVVPAAPVVVAPPLAAPVVVAPPPAAPALAPALPPAAPALPPAAPALAPAAPALAPATPPPRADTPPPRAATPPPRAATPPPRAATPAPRAATPAPRAATPAPRAPSPPQRPVRAPPAPPAPGGGARIRFSKISKAHTIGRRHPRIRSKNIQIRKTRKIKRCSY